MVFVHFLFFIDVGRQRQTFGSAFSVQPRMIAKETEKQNGARNGCVA
jgi:hypothetical protein